MLVALLLALGLCVSVPAWAGSPDAALALETVAPPRQALILVRTLAYDANLHARAGRTVNIAVVYKKGLARSERMAVRMAKAFAALTSAEVAGLPLAAETVGYGGPELLLKTVEADGIDVLYVCEGLEADLPALAEIARREKALTLGSRAEHVRAGLSLGVFSGEGKTVILLNLSSSRLEGAMFGADLLRLATVLR